MLDELKSTGRSLKRELKVYQLVLKDGRTPKLAKLLLGVAVGYALLPFDIIPDFIPVLGYLDDVIILPVLVIIALRMIPKEVIEDCRIRANGAR
ncbi:MAG: YkvA family protein [Chloroflexi bacterium]|nr:YkvA family protein [Chloroflexota bacterium]